MSVTIYQPSFAFLFKQYRLLSGFTSLSEFGKSLAEEGSYLDDSILSRWQRGNRIPRDRKLVLLVLKVFIKRNSLRTIEEANLFLEATESGNLTNTEIKELFPESDCDLGPRLNQTMAIKNGLNHYVSFFKQIGKRNPKSYGLIRDEFSTIVSLLEKSLSVKLFRESLLIWDYLAPFLWDSGKWDYLENLGRKIAGILEILAKDRSLAELLTNYLGRLAYWRGNLSHAERLLSRGHELSHEINDKDLIAQSKLKLGLVFQDQNDKIKAEDCFSYALKHFQKKNDKTLIAKTNLYLGGFYTRLSLRQKAENHFFTALSSSNDPENYTRSLQHIACILNVRGEKKKAKEYLYRSLRIGQKAKYKMTIAWAKKCLAIVENNAYYRKEADMIFQSIKAQPGKISTLLGV